MRSTTVLVFAVCLSAVGLVAARDARACGGGLVTTTSGGVAQGAQRILLSVRGGTTDVITQVAVPATTADYGVLLPVAAMPTLDPQPVATSELDTLDLLTAPAIYRSSGSTGCGCGASNKGGVGGDRGTVDAGPPVEIGPVTAVVLTGSSGDAVSGWLADNGFAIPADGQPIVDAYAGPGRYFIAIRRSDTAATGAPTSVGIHFSMPGDQRVLPLGFAKLGAAASVSFTLFVAADVVTAAAAPFATITLNDLDAGLLGMGDYPGAIAAAVSQRGGRAFVIEGAFSSSALSAQVGPGIAAIIGGGATDGGATDGRTVTRLSTIVPVAALSGDAALNGQFSGGLPPQYRTVERLAPGGGRGVRLASVGNLGLACVALVGFRRRRARRDQSPIR